MHAFVCLFVCWSGEPPGTGDTHQVLPQPVFCGALMPSFRSANNLFFPVTLVQQALNGWFSNEPKYLLDGPVEGLLEK